jgi:acyl-CoA thioester hydrolase
MARIHYFNALVGHDWNWLEDGVVLVKNEVEYLSPVYLHDSPEIRMFLIQLGTKSFTLGYEVVVKDRLVTKGSSVLVGFNSRLQQSIEIPLKMREALEQLS